ncbi:MAG: ABC-ATPase domain-containing protein [Actinobacteria bacterium]|nr:ABC-ATPase domain-containing protein [Actinomycetota bacterium]
MDSEGLKQKLLQLDGRGYKSYRSIRGAYSFPRFELFIDYVQGDPFAAPSRLRARVPQASAGFEPGLYDNEVRRVALEDYLARAFATAIASMVKGNRGTGKSGHIGVDSGGQEILERTAAVVNAGFAEVRFAAGLPADGRRCLGQEAVAMLIDEAPQLVDASLFMDALDAGAVWRHIEAAEDQQWLREWLRQEGQAGFVADGSLLARESGIRDLPLKGAGVVEFSSPPELRREVRLPNRGAVAGMAVPGGVTLIVGGGYHGKSTLLRALEFGVYSHIPGDGRELVACRADAVKIRAEDGRRVEKVDISPFVSNLPLDIDTTAFGTDNASGSTSQAANIVEALEAGSRLLLIDEDTSATNFMIRDELMQRLIAKDKEPITPFIDQVRNLEDEHGVSTVLVMGGSGDYFGVADTVIAMEDYRPRVVTAEARRIAGTRQDIRLSEGPGRFGPLRPRAPLPGSLNPRRGGREKVAAKSLRTIAFGRQTVDLSFVEQLVDRSQTRAIGDLVRLGLNRGFFDGEADLAAILDLMLAAVAEESLDALSPYAEDDAGAGRPGAHPGDYALPRRYEIAAMINRIRSLAVKE